MVGGAVCLLLFVFGAYWERTRVEIGQSVTSVPWLPSTASRVFYYRSYSRTAYEFDTDEKGFVSLSKSKGWDLRRIDKTAVEIPRYTWCIDPTVPYSETPADANGSEFLKAAAYFGGFDKSAFARISNGYSFETRIHTGGATQVAYDVTAKRAYVFLIPR